MHFNSNWIENLLEDEVNLLKTQKTQVLLVLSELLQLNDAANAHYFMLLKW